MGLNDFARLPLAHRPTPLEFLPRLTAHFGGPEIFVKRDDCTGLAGGGNKVRKLEYLLADARQRGATTIVTSGGIQSNHARQTAAAAARLGLACELVLADIVDVQQPAYRENGNVLLDRLFGAKLHVAPDSAAAQQKLNEICERVKAAGGLAYSIPVGGSNAMGALGYVSAVAELFSQCSTQGDTFDAIVVANGSAGTHAGILAGLAAVKRSIPVHGISVSGSASAQTSKTTRLVQETAALVGIQIANPEAIVRVHDNYVGPGYGLPTPGMYEAVALAAQSEGLLLDPVYTGKAMAGLIDLIRQGTFQRGQRVLFWHTGGSPGLFAYEPQLSAALQQSADAR